MTTKRLDQLANEIRDLSGESIWEAVGLLGRIDKLKGDERELFLLGFVRTLIRKRRWLELAEALIDSAASQQGYEVLDARARLALARGEASRAKALRALADTAPDAPSPEQLLSSEWATLETRRPLEKSDHARRTRLARYFAARRRLERSKR